MGVVRTRWGTLNARSGVGDADEQLVVGGEGCTVAEEKHERCGQTGQELGLPNAAGSRGGWETGGVAG